MKHRIKQDLDWYGTDKTTTEVTLPENTKVVRDISSWTSPTMKVNRVFARASHETFTIKPIKELLAKYVIGVWADPFAGNNSPATLTNDFDPDTKATNHKLAEEWVKFLPPNLDGVLFYPPYSYKQIKKHYNKLGYQPTVLDTSFNFYRRVISPLADKVKQGGLAISFGWNSNGFGKTNGFEIIEILLVAHGLHHNDTIVTVERKILQPLTKTQDKE